VFHLNGYFYLSLVAKEERAMTPFTRHLLMAFLLLGLFVAAMVALMRESNSYHAEANRIATATAWVTATADTQNSYALASNLAQRSIEIFDNNPRIALLLALESLARREHGAELPYMTMHALMQVLAEGTKVTLDHPQQMPDPSMDIVSRNGRWQVVVDSFTQDVMLYDLNTPVLNGYPLLWGPTQVTATQFSNDGNWLVITRRENEAYLWHLQGEMEMTQLSGHSQPVTAVAISPNGQWIATASHDTTIQLWSLSQGKVKQEPVLLRQHDNEDDTLDRAGHWQTVTALAFSPDSNWLASGSHDQTVRLWNMKVEDIAQWPILLTAPNEAIEQLSFTPDGMQLYASSRQFTYVWNINLPSLIARACEVTNGSMTPSEWASFMPALPYHDTCSAFE
jgi:WD40 repeat protein